MSYISNAAAIVVDPASAVIERAPLTKAFEIVSLVVEKRNTIPVLSNARLQGDGTSLFVTATDLDIELCVAVPAAADARFDITLPAHNLKDLLKKARASDFVAFTAPDAVDGKYPTGVPFKRFEGPAVVDFERVKYRLQAIHPSDFPELACPTFSHQFSIPGADLWRAIDATMGAMSTEETRYYLNGIFIHSRSNCAYGEPSLRLAATDGHRLYRQCLPLPDGAANMPGVILPRKMVTLFHKLTKGKACPAMVAVQVCETKIRLQWDSITLTSKLIDGSFPDYERVIPTGNSNVATLDQSELAEAMQSVGLISSERCRAIRYTFSAGAVALDVNNPDSGSAHATIAAEYDGDEIQIGFNTTYMADILPTASPDGGAIKLHMADAGSPMLVTGELDGWIGVLMPMRT